MNKLTFNVHTFKRMATYSYLAQSRRLAKIISSLIGKSHWTNYYGWEYSFGQIELELSYIEYQGEERFKFRDRFSCKVIFKTNSIKEAVQFIKTNK